MALNKTFLWEVLYAILSHGNITSCGNALHGKSISTKEFSRCGATHGHACNNEIVIECYFTYVCTYVLHTYALYILYFHILHAYVPAFSTSDLMELYRMTHEASESKKIIMQLYDYYAQ